MDIIPKHGYKDVRSPDDYLIVHGRFWPYKCISISFNTEIMQMSLKIIDRLDKYFQQTY